MIKRRSWAERAEGAQQTPTGGPEPRMRAATLPCVVLLMVAACWVAPGSGPSVTQDPGTFATSSPRTVAAPAVRLVFIGDVMLGRGVAEVAAHDPGSIFERLRPALVEADLAMANLESPLTTRPHATSGHALEAEPGVARSSRVPGSMS